jgi:hypothetical protein
VDRFAVAHSGNPTFSLQQISDAPTGFVNSMRWTTTNATGAYDFSLITQTIEGTNISDLAWGSANAKTVTLSFWTKSSLTGTFGGALNNSDSTRLYPFTYTISAANTWEYKTVTITGDISGTWLTTTGRGINVRWQMGSTSTYTGTNNIWQTVSAKYAASGCVQILETLNATWQITGVQLEVGSFATTFERRPYGTEFMLCQRYLPAYRATGSGNQDIASGLCISSTACYFGFDFVVQPRVEPTGVTISAAGHFGAVNNAFSATNLFTGLSFSIASTKRALLTGTGSSGLVQGDATFVRSQNSGAYMLFTGCEL